MLANRAHSNAIIILGIDPGLQKTGWGVVEQTGQSLRFIACGSIHPSPSLCMADRLLILGADLQQIMAQHRPHEAAVEETFINNNSGSSLKLGQARGALLLTLAMGGLPVAEYAATRAKKSLTGVGRASKEQIAMMVATLLPQARSTIEAAGEDARDALAVAICHAHYAALNRKIAS